MIRAAVALLAAVTLTAAATTYVLCSVLLPSDATDSPEREDHA